jgi:hypothetical protein
MGVCGGRGRYVSVCNGGVRRARWDAARGLGSAIWLHAARMHGVCGGPHAHGHARHSRQRLAACAHACPPPNSSSQDRALTHRRGGGGGLKGRGLIGGRFPQHRARETFIEICKCGVGCCVRLYRVHLSWKCHARSSMQQAWSTPAARRQLTKPALCAPSAPAASHEHQENI